MNKTLIDNSSEQLSMVHTIKECMRTEGINHIRIATGYWDLLGTALILDELKDFLAVEGNRIDLLIGKDPYVYSSQLNSLPCNLEKPKYPDDFIRKNIEELDFSEENMEVVNILNTYCDGDDPAFKIKLFKISSTDEPSFLHSKCYIFTGKKASGSKWSYGIIGSSNFTRNGLKYPEGNSELNVLEEDHQFINFNDDEDKSKKGHVQWFEEKWNKIDELWNKDFLLKVLHGTPIQTEVDKKKKEEKNLSAPLTPYELYIKLLQTRFGNIVDKNLGKQIEQYLPRYYNTYDYQIDAVKQCFHTMKEHGGFMLADVVGLGKTVVGTLLIKHFLQFPDEDGREQKVLIITPPAIQSAWKRTIEEFDANDELKIAHFVTYITTGSIGKLTDDEMEDENEDHDSGEFNEELRQENYGLIIVDESHKFRNSTTVMYEALDTLISNIGAETGVYPYIGLLSATPQNNRPSDLQNQIYLFERNHTESTLKKAKGGNLEGFFADINRRFSSIMHPKDEDGNPITLSIEETNSLLKELSIEIRNCVLSDVMVRRTRTDVQKYYAADKEHQGMKFPIINGPISLKYNMSKSLSLLFFDTMKGIAPVDIQEEGLRYYRYRAIQYLVNTDNKQKYKGKGSRDADKLADQLANIMQIGLVKRLESSFTAFKQSLLNLRQYTQNMIDMWNHDTIFICPDINVNDELDRKKKESKRKHKVTIEECFKDIRTKIQKLTDSGRNDNGSNKEYHCADFDPNYIDYLHYDMEIINDLCTRWSMNSEDPKFDVFKEELKPTLFNPETNTAHKLVVFTEAIDTAKSIAAAAEAKGYNVLTITAENRDENEQIIRENFDANYNGEMKNDYDIIVTTDVLAEGINLHRANCIVNYDTPWNSTKLMQRIGRVNRIGSTADYVNVYNFMPSAQGDAEINLVQKAHNKLQSFHTLFGEDSQVFTDTEEISHYDLNTQVNGEESPLEKYVFELKQYKEKHPERYAFIEQATEGLQLATKETDGTAYFLVRTPKVSGMFVQVVPDEKEGSVISLGDGLEAFRADETATACALPDNWEELCREAERVITAELASVRLLRSNSKKTTEAKGAIIKMKNEITMSPESKRILNAADKLIRQGNMDMVKRILILANKVSEKQSLFPITQEEFETFLNDGIANFVANAQQKNGKPEIILGTYKK